MGIKNLNKFLNKHAPRVFRESHLSKYATKKVAVDINVYLYRFKSMHKERWLSALFNLIMTLLSHQITCVFIYDTKAPMEKDDRKKERRQKKRNAEKRMQDIQVAIGSYETSGKLPPILENIMDKRSFRLQRLNAEVSLDREAVSKELEQLENQVINVTRADILASKELLRLLGIPAYDSNDEAETLCSHFCIHQQVDAVLSNDTDVLVYGTPIFISKLNTHTGVCTETQYPEILDSLSLTKNQFTDFCIMCGTDYNKNIFRIGCEKAFKLIKKYGSIEDIRENMAINVEILNHERVREIFRTPETLPSHYVLTHAEPDIYNLEAFAAHHNMVINTNTVTKLTSRISAPPGNFTAVASTQ